jgi:hypothetical protein
MPTELKDCLNFKQLGFKTIQIFCMVPTKNRTDSLHGNRTDFLHAIFDYSFEVTASLRARCMPAGNAMPKYLALR